ncbi:superoxide dismutase [Cu-Zn]-like [Penaeus monodon]|uniref:superoxide dismutase [Cu-Zn]-like n=1 Tax=Penaeus monodon TaxID=6687 RepID=UPI0018A7D5FC|nr:superoxide dismutase [Cu-Zn]-like [Penaeus monodon]
MVSRHIGIRGNELSPFAENGRGSPPKTQIKNSDRSLLGGKCTPSSGKEIMRDASPRVQGPAGKPPPGKHRAHKTTKRPVSSACTVPPTTMRVHVGDLGNVLADGDGLAKVNITDPVISLKATFSVIGPLRLHAGEATFGDGGNGKSLKRGAKSRSTSGLGVIGFAFEGDA